MLSAVCASLKKKKSGEPCISTRTTTVLFSENSEKTKEETEDPFDPSPVPDMCRPSEGERISDLPDVITSTRTEGSENRSASPSLVCDNSPVHPVEDMDISEEPPNVLIQSGSSNVANQSVERSASSNISEINEVTDKSSSDNKQAEVSTESIVLEIKDTESMDVVTSSNVISYQSNVDKSVEEKRAEHYSKVDTQEATRGEDSSAQENQINSEEEAKDAENSATEMVQDTKETDGSSQGLVDIPLDSENVGQTDNDSSNTQLQDNTEVLHKEGTISEQNVNNNHSDEPLESSSNTKSGHVHIHLDNTNDFDSFQFWRTPIPQLDLDLDIVDGKPQNIHVTARVKDQEHHKVYASEMNVQVGDKDTYTNLSDSMSDLTVCDKLDNTVMNTNRSESISEDEGVKIHRASVSSVSDVDRGTKSTSGQTENTLTVIDGVVQGKI